MEKIVEQGLLYDFYGELLTQHQRRIYEDIVYRDFSLGEIAQEQGISRQGVHDLINRCNKTMQDYENKLHLINRFIKIKNEITSLQELAKNPQMTKEELVILINQVSNTIFEEL